MTADSPPRDRLPAALMLAVIVLPVAALGLVSGEEPVWRATYYAEPDFSGRAVVRRERFAGHTAGRALPDGVGASGILAAEWEADLLVERAGPAAFMLTSNGGSELTVNGRTAISNWGAPGRPRRTRGALVELPAGKVRLEVSYRGPARDPVVILEATLDGRRPRRIDPALLAYPQGSE